MYTYLFTVTTGKLVLTVDFLHEKRRRVVKIRKRSWKFTFKNIFLIGCGIILQDSHKMKDER